jgi:hypothetical protein
MMFIVLIVSPMEMHVIRTKKSSIFSEDVQDRLCEFMNENIQDPHVAGTVVFRGQRFTHHCFFDKEEIALVMISNPTFQDIECATLDASR